MKRFEEEYKKELDELSPSEEQCARIREAVLREAKKPGKSKKRVFIPIGAAAAALCGFFVITVLVRGGFTKANFYDNTNTAGRPEQAVMAPSAAQAADNANEESVDITTAAPTVDFNMAPAAVEKADGDIATGGAAMDTADENDFAGVDDDGAVAAEDDKDIYPSADVVEVGGIDSIPSEKGIIVFSEDETFLEYNGIKYVLIEKNLLNDWYDEEELTKVYDNFFREYFVHFDGNNLEVFDCYNRFIGVFTPETDDSSH